VRHLPPKSCDGRADLVFVRPRFRLNGKGNGGFRQLRRAVEDGAASPQRFAGRRSLSLAMADVSGVSSETSRQLFPARPGCAESVPASNRLKFINVASFFQPLPAASTLDVAGRSVNLLNSRKRLLKNDATLMNFNRSMPERFQHILVVQGKQLTEVSELHAGDIGAIAKLKETTTGETLGEKAAPIFYSPAQLPEPSITFAIEPKTRADEDKIGTSIHKILEEDAALRFSATRRPRSSCWRVQGSNTSKSCGQAAQAVSRRSHAQAAQGALSRNDSAARPTPKASTKNNPAATGSSACAGSKWSRSNEARASSLSTMFLVARSLATGFPRSNEESVTRRRAAI